MSYRVYVKEAGKRRVRAYCDAFRNNLLPAEDEGQAEREAMRLLDQCALYTGKGAIIYPEEAELVILEYGYSYREPIKIVI